MYQKLADELMEREIDWNCLARKLDICVMSVCDRFSGKKPHGLPASSRRFWI